VGKKGISENVQEGEKVARKGGSFAVQGRRKEELLK